MSRFASALFVLALTAAAQAHADEPVATANGTGAPPTTPAEAPPPVAAPVTAGAPLSTAAQIEAFIRSAPPPVLDDGQPNGATTSAAIDEPRKVHGEVGLSVGSGGYRSGYAVSVMPLGKTGSLTLAVSDTKYGKYGGPYGGYGYGFGGPGYGYGPRGGYYGQGGSNQSLAVGLQLGGSSTDDTCRRPRGYDAFAGFQPLPVPGPDQPPCRPRDGAR